MLVLQCGESKRIHLIATYHTQVILRCRTGMNILIGMFFVTSEIL